MFTLTSDPWLLHTTVAEQWNQFPQSFRDQEIDLLSQIDNYLPGTFLAVENKTCLNICFLNVIVY